MTRFWSNGYAMTTILEERETATEIRRTTAFLYIIELFERGNQKKTIVRTAELQKGA
jgi:hypothetical protein